MRGVTMHRYHMILVTKRRSVAMIGTHKVYKIEDTMMVSVNPNEITAASQDVKEQRYMKMFQNVDMRSNFYFSYT